MPQVNILSSKVTLKESVKSGQIVSWNGELATTGSADKEPAGIAQYDGAPGEIIAIVNIGTWDVAQSGLKVGDLVKSNAGVVEKADSITEAFATVSQILGSTSAEILIK